MTEEYSFCIRFSGLTLRFVSPTSITLPECFTALLCEDTENPDAEYKVCLLNAPLCPETDPIHKEGDSYIYVTNEGCLRIYSALTADDGCQVACLLRPNKKNTLYYPAEMWKHYREYWHCAHLIWGELLLLWQNAFLLHSSVILKDGRTVLFSGPSGAGKSTQAALWAEHLNADIINGDRCVVMKKDDSFYGGGSIWSGTSGIYRPEQAPIAGIFLLRKGPENHVRRLGIEAFAPLFSQTTVNSWDSEFVEKVSGMYTELLSQIPVYELTCRPDKEAVTLAYNTIFRKENTT